MGSGFVEPVSECHLQPVQRGHQRRADFEVLLFPEFSLVVCDQTIVSITVAEERWLGGVDLVGLTLSDVAQMLRLSVFERSGAETEVWTLSGGVEFYARGGLVTRLSLSDWSLVNN